MNDPNGASRTTRRRGRPASGGPGPLPATVARYGLGVAVEPDSAAAIAAGLARLVAERPDVAAGFAEYRTSTSWEVNVDRLLEVVEGLGRKLEITGGKTR